MNVKNTEKLAGSKVAVTVEVSAEEFESAIQKAYLKMRNKINVPGFRPGKAPRKMIEKMYGVEVFYNDAVDAILPEAYTNAVASSGLDIIGYPDIEIVDDKIDRSGFTFKATVAVYPEVKLGQYKGVSAVKADTSVSADDVKARLNELAEKSARLTSVDRKAKKGDIAVIDFEGFDNGVAFEGGKGENYELALGSGSFVPGFEDQVIGMKAGEEKDLDITFPEDYTPELAGKAVVFKVKVNEVKVKELPAIDDEFAKDVSEFDTLKELKADLKEKMVAEREQAAKFAFEDALMMKIAENIEVEIPDALIDDQCQKFVENFKQRIASQGIPYEQYLQMTGMTDEAMIAEARKPAEQQVRIDLAIGAIIKAEKIEVTDEEIEAKYEEMAKSYGMEIDMLKKYIDKASLSQNLLNDKALAIVVENAKAEKPESAKKTTKKAAEGEEKPAKKTTKKAAEGEEKPAKKTTKKAAEGEEKKPAAKKTAKKAE
ncbi:MAG: trigger factor [Oscillospiraceae bacterium]|nr:trigger factor [Oscillospiraceae bacterium]